MTISNQVLKLCAVLILLKCNWFRYLSADQSGLR